MPSLSTWLETTSSPTIQAHRLILQSLPPTRCDKYQIVTHGKYTPKFPLGQFLADFEIRSGKIDLNWLINAWGNRAASVGGRFYYREGVYKTCARTPKNTPQIQSHHQRLPPRSIFVGFWNLNWQNRSKLVDRHIWWQGGERLRAVLFQGGGLSNARAHPKKYTPKSATSSKLCLSSPGTVISDSVHCIPLTHSTVSSGISCHPFDRMLEKDDVKSSLARTHRPPPLTTLLGPCFFEV